MEIKTQMLHFLFKTIYLWRLILVIKPINSYQSYNPDCTSHSRAEFPNYVCNLGYGECATYAIYRAQQNFNTIYSISQLFGVHPADLVSINNLDEDVYDGFPLGREVIVPVYCQCTLGISRSMFTYRYYGNDSLAGVACQDFEGLVNNQSLVEENPDTGHPNGTLIEIKVPIRCACPDSNQTANGINLLVTYPIVAGDELNIIAHKFGVLENLILEANKLTLETTIFTQTTLLIPTNSIKNVNWSIVAHPPQSSLHPIPVKTVFPGEPKSIDLNKYLKVGIPLAVLMMAVAVCWVVHNIRRRISFEIFQTLTGRSSVSTNISDFLDGVSRLKHSFIIYDVEELKTATDNFSEAYRISKTVYHGVNKQADLSIEQMDSEESANHVIQILTKINHLNILKLEGWCLESKSYLVFEFAENGSLRDCLSNKSLNRKLTWTIRKQILYNLAVAIHYIHYCTTPNFVHLNLKSRNVSITINWRAKITGFELARPLIQTGEGETKPNDSVVIDGYLAPEYTNGKLSLKLDVFAFGVILLELISAKEDIAEGKLLKDSIDFLVDTELAGSPACLEKFKAFVDPLLEDNYQLADAICLAFLAKACVQEYPDHRPTMNDIIKAISKVL